MTPPAARTVYAIPLLLALSVTLILRGYQYGGGNHTVYLLAPLQKVHPEILKHDWWTNHTLQYHLAFTETTALLMRLGVERPAFLLAYLALAVLLHLAWLRITLALGLNARHYLLSVLLYYLSAGGTALGSYQFLQDSSLLPGNVANVAMLWAIAFFITGRRWPSAACFAVAALFHLNHAIVALAFWFAAAFFHRWHGRPVRDFLPGFVAIFLLALPNLIPALRASLAATTKLPLDQFVDLYVRLRHPHHYNLLSWPAALWISFLWPIPLAVTAYLRLQKGGNGGWKMEDGTEPPAPSSVLHPSSSALHNAAFTFLFFTALAVIGLLFAGVFFVSEPLIQMSLFRFSIYPKLLACVGAAAFLLHPALLARRSVRLALLVLPAVLLAALLVFRLARPNSSAGLFVSANLIPLLLFVGAFAASLLYILTRPSILHLPSSLFVFLLTATLFLTWSNWLGLRLSLDAADDRHYLAACRFARDQTPTDAVFLVPPNEQLFRFHARRAIVVNFKNVPQLSSEIPEWRRRLEAVLDLPLAQLPRRFDQAHTAIAARYDALPTAHLAATAARYNAGYLLTTRPHPTLRPVFENPGYHLYDLSHSRALPDPSSRPATEAR